MMQSKRLLCDCAERHKRKTSHRGIDIIYIRPIYGSTITYFRLTTKCPSNSNLVQTIYTGDSISNCILILL